MENQQIIIERLFNATATKVWNALTSQAKGIGFPNKANNAIVRVLENCLYAGLIRVNNDDGSATYIKGLHEPIINEVDFWLVQEIRGGKKPTKMKSKKEFLLKGVLKCDCGKYMTAGWSKGKKKYYLYYHCRIHRSLNVSGSFIHEQLIELLKNLELTSEHLRYLLKSVEINLEEVLRDHEQQILGRQKLAIELDKKKEYLEEHFINKHIDIATFKKWTERYSEEFNLLEEQIKKLKVDNITQRQNVAQFTEKLNNVYQAYESCSFIQKQALLKYLFRYGLTYVHDNLNAYKICPVFNDAIMILNRKKLLLIKETSAVNVDGENQKFLDFFAELIVEISK